MSKSSVEYWSQVRDAFQYRKRYGNLCVGRFMRIGMRCQKTDFQKRLRIPGEYGEFFRNTYVKMVNKVDFQKRLRIPGE